jgi:large subunit ribosomal protein L31
MKSDIHPDYREITVSCACGNTYKTRAVLDRDLSLEICSKCHPFYTGNQRIVDTAGRVDRFQQRYGKKKEG